MESLILSQNTCWKQKIGYKMSGTLRGEIWGLSFAVPHSAYVALFHNDLCFTANHCIIRPILGVSSMGLHPGWIPLPNITSQWSVLYGNPLKCKSNFRSLLHRISSWIYPGWIPHHHYSFKAAHCMVRPILGVFSMGFHPGWIQISALC